MPDTKGENIKNIRSTQPGDWASQTYPIESISNHWGNEGSLINWTKELRWRRTLRAIAPIIPEGSTILDLGGTSHLVSCMQSNGYVVRNTDFDLDLHPEYFSNYEHFDYITAFEVLEHVLNPFTILNLLPSDRLLATVPLNVWFSSAYWNINDEFDRHFHEYEAKQFDWLLHKAGWNIVKKERWNLGLQGIGIRPILRLFWPSYYFVYAERVSDA